MSEKYKIGDVSRLFDIPAQTLRYYEEQGILHPEKSENSGYRYYDAIVVSMGYHPNNALIDELACIKEKVVVVGDALKARNAMEAASEGYDAGYYA